MPAALTTPRVGTVAHLPPLMGCPRSLGEPAWRRACHDLTATSLPVYHAPCSHPLVCARVPPAATTTSASFLPVRPRHAAAAATVHLTAPASPSQPSSACYTPGASRRRCGHLSPPVHHHHATQLRGEEPQDLSTLPTHVVNATFAGAGVAGSDGSLQDGVARMAGKNVFVDALRTRPLRMCSALAGVRARHPVPPALPNNFWHHHQTPAISTATMKDNFRDPELVRKNRPRPHRHNVSSLDWSLDSNDHFPRLP